MSTHAIRSIEEQIAQRDSDESLIRKKASFIQHTDTKTAVELIEAADSLHEGTSELREDLKKASLFSDTNHTRNFIRRSLHGKK